MTKLFAPSSEALTVMIDRAMQKCDGDIEQAALKKEARAIRRMEKSIEAEAAGEVFGNGGDAAVFRVRGTPFAGIIMTRRVMQPPEMPIWCKTKILAPKKATAKKADDKADDKVAA